MAKLFDEFSLRGVTLRNRICVSPMCQYSADDGKLTDWHLVHLGARAVGGAGLVMVEMTNVEARGRITRGCSGIWSDEHVEPLARVARFVSGQGAVAGIQIGHAGRKGSCAPTWEGGGYLSDEEGGWEIVAPSAVPFHDKARVPKALSVEEIALIQEAFRQGARRADEAGFGWLEIHGAHGVSLPQFPFSGFEPKRGQLRRQFREPHPLHVGDGPDREGAVAGE